MAIPLTQDWVAWVDSEDYPLLASRNWHAWSSDGRRYYARAYDRDDSFRWKRRAVHMHRLVAGESLGCQIDHVVHRTDKVIDNRKRNLRPVSKTQNLVNTGKVTRLGCATSRYKGVWKSPAMVRWYAHIRVNGQGRRLGLFEREEDAARAYDEAAVAAFGEHACTNFKTAGARNWIFDLTPDGFVPRRYEVA